MTSQAETARCPIDSSAEPACPICGAHPAVARFEGKDQLFGLAPGRFALFRCPSCGCIFQNPIPEPSVLAGFYPKAYWGTGDPVQGSRWARLFYRMENAYRELSVAGHARFLDSCARKRPSAGKRLLDIGCGDGVFLHVARKHGFIPYGMDWSVQAVERARARYGLDVRGGEIGAGIWNGMRFDFVSMFHVLEHLPDPRAALSYAKELLQPGGALIIQVPNASSLQARIFGARWYGLDVPRHVVNYTPKALRFILREAGFQFRLSSRFSLRDNPASIASSLLPRLDPKGRKARELQSRPVFNAAAEMAYLGLYSLVLPAAYLESACGFGETLWACAQGDKIVE